MQPFLRLLPVFLFLATAISGLAADWQHAFVKPMSEWGDEIDDVSDVHKEPNRNSPVVTSLYNGRDFKTKPSNSEWWPVKLDSGKTGFMQRSDIVLKKDADEFYWQYVGGWRVTGIERLSAKKIVYTLESFKGEKRKFDFQQTFENDPLFVGQKVYYPYPGDESVIGFSADTVRWRKIDSNTVQVILRTSFDKKFISLVPDYVEIASYSQIVEIRSDRISVSYEKGPEDAELESFVSDARLPELQLANKSGKKVASAAGWISTKKAGVAGDNGKRIEVYQ